MSELEQLMATPEQERAFRQGYDRGWRAAMEYQKTPKRPRKKDHFVEGLRKRADWFTYRSDLALQAGDTERAAKLEAWALDALSQLWEMTR